MLKFCPRCRAAVEDGALFCSSCGSYLGVCLHCGTVVPKEQLLLTDLCPSCGQRLDSVPASGPAEGIKWRVGDVLKVFGILVVVQAILAFLPSVGLSVTQEWIAAYLFLLLSFAYLPLLVLTLYYIRKRGGRVNQIGISPARPKHFVLGVFFGLALMIASALVSILLAPFGLVPAQESLREIMGLPGVFPTMLLWAGILAPIIEEIFFRGFCYGAFKSRWGRGIAIAISSLLFAVAHFDPLGVVQFTVLGVLLAYAYDRTGSLPLVTVAHVMNNTVAIILAFLVV